MNKNQKTKDIIVALDIGTTKVCAIAGYRDKHGRIKVLSAGNVSSNGVLRGVISNIDKTVKAINQAIDKISHSVPYKIKELHLGIAGQHIHSFQYPGNRMRDNAQEEISRVDINALFNDMHKIGLPAGEEILHIIPQEYTVDNEKGIVDPIGMSGSRLQTNFHIITGQVSALNNLKRCISKAKMTICDIILEPIASANAVLNEKEIEAGIALVDIGGGTTDLAIYHEGILRHTAVIPLGGSIITNDIREGFTIMKDQAEKLKVKYGSALTDEVLKNRTIIIPGIHENDEKRVTEKNLALIIQARVEEILDYVYSEIIRSGYSEKLVGGIVLTGGGAMLNNIKDLAELHTGMKARVGLPSENLAHGYNEEFDKPSYATAIGLLMEGIKIQESKAAKALTEVSDKQKESTDEKQGTLEFKAKQKENLQPKNDENSPKDGGIFGRNFDKIRKFFEAAPDSQL